MVETLQPWHLLALLGAGVAAGFVNVVAGGGSLLTMPLLVFVGVPEGAANGTARVAILVQNAAAVWRYRQAGRLDLGLLRSLLPPALVGAGAGAAIGAHLPDGGFRIVLGWAMLGCAVLVAWGPSFAAPAADGPPRGAVLSPWRVWPLLFAIGVYGGAIQVGVGYLILAVLTIALRLPLVEANILKVVLVFAYTPIALVLFFSQGKVDLALGLLLSVGQAVGAVLGASAALQRGQRLIRALLLVAVVASAAKLIWD